MAKNRDLSKLANRLTVDNNYNVGISGSLTVTGSIISTVTTLWSGSAQLPSGVVSGSAQTIAHLPSGTVSGSAQTIANLPSGVVSGSAQTIANLPSGTVSGSAQVDVMSTTNIARLATTGSNTFQGNQTINGSLVVTGSLTAQQFIVSSSVTYLTESFASGSHKFGDSSDDYHDFTGSVRISGSIVSTTTALVSGSAQVDVLSTTNIARIATTGSNTFTSNQIVTGSVLITGSINVTGSLLTTGSSVGIGGQANPARTLHVMGQGAFDMTHAGVVIQDSISPMTASQIVSYKQTNAVGSAYRNMHLRADVLGIAIMSGSGYVSIGKDSANSMLDINGNTLVSGSLTTTGDLTVNSNGAIFNRTSSGEPYLFFRKDGVNRGSIYGITGGGLRMFDQSDNQVFTMTGSMIGISDSTPSKRLSVNYGSTQLGGMTVYGSMRQETIFKSTGEHCFIYIDSAHSSTYYPMLSLQRSSTTYGTVQLQRASNSDNYSTFTESEMVIGTTTQTPTSLQMNGNRKLVIDTNGNTNVIGTATISGALTVNSNGFSLKGWRQYAVQISAGGSTNTGAIIFRQFQDSVNWNTGGVVVEIINYSYANSEYDTRKDFARYGYSGNAAAINTLYGNVTGKIPQPYWGSAVQGSGNYYYRDLMIDIPPYHAYVISLTTAMSLNGNSTVGNGSIYLFS